MSTYHLSSRHNLQIYFFPAQEWHWRQFGSVNVLCTHIYFCLGGAVLFLKVIHANTKRMTMTPARVPLATMEEYSAVCRIALERKQKNLVNCASRKRITMQVQRYRFSFLVTFTL